MGMKISTRRALDAMVGPQCLRPVGDFDRCERRPARMTRGEARMAGGMPILSQYHVIETVDKLVDLGHDVVAAADRQCSAGAKVILRIDDDECGVFGRHVCYFFSGHLAELNE